MKRQKENRTRQKTEEGRSITTKEYLGEGGGLHKEEKEVPQRRTGEKHGADSENAFL